MPRDRRRPVRLRAKRYGETSTELEERSRGGGGQQGNYRPMSFQTPGSTAPATKSFTTSATMNG
jgi:hypothetical protein